MFELNFNQSGSASHLKCRPLCSYILDWYVDKIGIHRIFVNWIKGTREMLLLKKKNIKSVLFPQVWYSSSLQGSWDFGRVRHFRWTLLSLRDFSPACVSVLLQGNDCEICIFRSGFAPCLPDASRNNWWWFESVPIVQILALSLQVCIKEGLWPWNMDYDFHICSTRESRHVTASSEPWWYRDTLTIIFLYDSSVLKL